MASLNLHLQQNEPKNYFFTIVPRFLQKIEFCHDKNWQNFFDIHNSQNYKKFPPFFYFRNFVSIEPHSGTDIYNEYRNRFSDFRFIAPPQDTLNPVQPPTVPMETTPILTVEKEQRVQNWVLSVTPEMTAKVIPPPPPAFRDKPPKPADEVETMATKILRGPITTLTTCDDAEMAVVSDVRKELDTFTIPLPVFPQPSAISLGQEVSFSDTSKHSSKSHFSPSTTKFTPYFSKFSTFTTKFQSNNSPEDSDR